MIPLFQIKTADKAHAGIFASDTRGPFPGFWVGPGDEANPQVYL